jgi:hypothetical protein
MSQAVESTHQVTYAEAPISAAMGACGVGATGGTCVRPVRIQVRR